MFDEEPTSSSLRSHHVQVERVVSSPLTLTPFHTPNDLESPRLLSPFSLPAPQQSTAAARRHYAEASGSTMARREWSTGCGGVGEEGTKAVRHTASPALGPEEDRRRGCGVPQPGGGITGTAKVLSQQRRRSCEGAEVRVRGVVESTPALSLSLSPLPTPAPLLGLRSHDANRRRNSQRRRETKIRETRVWRREREPQPSPELRLLSASAPAPRIAIPVLSEQEGRRRLSDSAQAAFMDAAATAAESSPHIPVPRRITLTHTTTPPTPSRKQHSAGEGGALPVTTEVEMMPADTTLPTTHTHSSDALPVMTAGDETEGSSSRYRRAMRIKPVVFSDDRSPTIQEGFTETSAAADGPCVSLRAEPALFSFAEEPQRLAPALSKLASSHQRPQTDSMEHQDALHAPPCHHPSTALKGEKSSPPVLPEAEVEEEPNTPKEAATVQPRTAEILLQDFTEQPRPSEGMEMSGQISALTVMQMGLQRPVTVQALVREYLQGVEDPMHSTSPSHPGAVVTFDVTESQQRGWRDTVESPCAAVRAGPTPPRAPLQAEPVGEAVARQTGQIQSAGSAGKPVIYGSYNTGDFSISDHLFSYLMFQSISQSKLNIR